MAMSELKTKPLEHIRNLSIIAHAKQTAGLFATQKKGAAL